MIITDVGKSSGVILRIFPNILLGIREMLFAIHYRYARTRTTRNLEKCHETLCRLSGDPLPLGLNPSRPAEGEELRGSLG